MKKIFYTIMLAAVVFAGCKKEVKTDGTGFLKLNLDRSSAGYVTKATNSDTREFVIDINRPADNWTRTYPRFADMPAQLDLPSGHYSITASSLYQEPAAWDQPIYSGTKEFNIVTGELTSVGIVCTLANMKVTIATTANFNEEVSSYTVKVTNAYDWKAPDVAQKTLTWEKNSERDDITECREGYFTVAPLLISVDGYRSIDYDAPDNVCHVEKAITRVSARDHHVIMLDAKVTGQAGFDITIDTSVNEKVDDVEVPGFTQEEALANAPARQDDCFLIPSILGEGGDR